MAPPGYSNHGWGIAFDIAWFIASKIVNVQTNAVGWQWVQNHAVEFGFSWEGAMPGQPGFEAWHLRYVCAENIPARVQQYIDWVAAHPSP